MDEEVLADAAVPAQPVDNPAEGAAPADGGEADAGAAAKPDGDDVELTECPICCDMKSTVTMLVHRGQNKDASNPNSEIVSRTLSGRDTSEHKACKECQEQMVAKGQSCPWCRDEVVWQDIFGFLDGIKGATVQAQDPNSLADLMAKWQEYELTRSQSDVLVFAKNMVEDVALFKHLERAVESQHGFIRDSSGLWCRFYAMIVDGELKVEDKCRTLLTKAVTDCLERFDADGGTAPQYGGAVYAQVAAAYMCAMCSGMSTTTLIPICKQIGLALCKHWETRSGEVKQLLPKYFAEALSDVVWGSVEEDKVMQTFFLAPKEPEAPQFGGGLFAAAPAAVENDGEEDEDEEESEEPQVEIAADKQAGGNEEPFRVEQPPVAAAAAAADASPQPFVFTKAKGSPFAFGKSKSGGPPSFVFGGAAAAAESNPRPFAFGGAAVASAKADGSPRPFAFKAGKPPSSLFGAATAPREPVAESANAAAADGAGAEQPVEDAEAS